MANDSQKLNYYEVLDLSPNTATHETIKSKYLELKAFYSSSDLVANNVFSEAEVKGLVELLEEAYAVLGNQILREIYNEKLQLRPALNGSNSTGVVTPGPGPSSVAQVSAPISGSFGSAGGSTVETNVQVATPPSRHEPSAKVLQKMEWRLDYEILDDQESWISSCQHWDGLALKRVREYKKVSLNLLSQFTKINPFYITAIEEMNSENLPAPVFVRGYIVQISRALGLSEEKVVASFMKQYQLVCDKRKNASL